MTRSNNWVDELAQVIDGGAILRDRVDLLSFTRDASDCVPGDPQAVVRARTPEEVSEVLRFAAPRKVPVYSRGAGTMYAGGVNPVAGGIVFDATAMNRIIDIDETRGLVVVEPGVLFTRLLSELESKGLTIGIVPSTGSSATVGGAVSSNALGTGSAKFQSMADEVAGLEVVLADGRIVRTGTGASAAAGFFQRFAIGPDLTGLFLGGDGTMGIVTKIALWTHPLPEYQETLCIGFPDYPSGAAFVSGVQIRDLTRNVWYGAGYDAVAVAGRMKGIDPAADPAAHPKIVFGLDMGGYEEEVVRDHARLLEIAADHGGAEHAPFNEGYFKTLRRDQKFWYSFAGYYAPSRCSILMSSLPADGIPRFLDQVNAWRGEHSEFLWGAAVVLCRRGLHGGVMTFYDEASQWDEARTTVQSCISRLMEIGCVPYKSGKIWASAVQGLDGYHSTLTKIKQSLDPEGILAPGNLGL